MYAGKDFGAACVRQGYCLYLAQLLQRKIIFLKMFLFIPYLYKSEKMTIIPIKSVIIFF